MIVIMNGSTGRAMKECNVKALTALVKAGVVSKTDGLRAVVALSEPVECTTAVEFIGDMDIKDI